MKIGSSGSTRNDSIRGIASEYIPAATDGLCDFGCRIISQPIKAEYGAAACGNHKAGIAEWISTRKTGISDGHSQIR